MNEILTSKENIKTAAELKLFGMHRPLAGALIGTFLFLLAEAILWSAKLITAFLILLSPGISIVWITIPGIIAWSTSIEARILTYSILFGISAIPPAFLGSLVVSKEKVTRSKGIGLSIKYISLFCLLSVYLSLLFLINSDFYKI